MSDEWRPKDWVSWLNGDQNVIYEAGASDMLKALREAPEDGTIVDRGLFVGESGKKYHLIFVPFDDDKITLEQLVDESENIERPIIVSPGMATQLKKDIEVFEKPLTFICRKPPGTNCELNQFCPHQEKHLHRKDCELKCQYGRCVKTGGD